jgi:hypothetical protein
MYTASQDGEYTSKGYNFANPESLSNGNFAFYKVELVPSPSRFVMLADTMVKIASTESDSYKPNWQLRTTYAGVASYPHLRHFGFAACGFSDGHAATQNASQLRGSSTVFHYFYSADFGLINKP